MKTCPKWPKYFSKITFSFCFENKSQCILTSLENMKNGPDGLPHSSFLKLRKDSFFLFHICSLEADIMRPRKQQIKQFGSEYDGYENITGLIKNLSTITKNEREGINSLGRSVLQFKSLGSSCVIGINPETLFQNTQNLEKATICHANGTSDSCCLHELWLMKDMLWMIQVIALHKLGYRQAMAWLDSGTNTSSLLGHSYPQHSSHLLSCG